MADTVYTEAKKQGRKMINPKTCWCASKVLCCPTHRTHVEPHRNCVMR